MEFLAEGLQLLKKENQELKRQLRNNKQIVNSLLNFSKQTNSNRQISIDDLYRENTILKFQLQQAKKKIGSAQQKWSKQTNKLKIENTQNLKDAERRVQIAIQQVQIIQKENQKLYDDLQLRKFLCDDKINQLQQQTAKAKQKYESQLQIIAQQYQSRIENECKKTQKQILILQKELEKSTLNVRILSQQKQNLLECLKKQRNLSQTQQVSVSKDTIKLKEAIQKLKNQNQILRQAIFQKQFKQKDQINQLVEQRHIIRELKKLTQNLTKKLKEAQTEKQKQILKQKIISKRAVENFSVSQKALKAQVQVTKKKQKDHRDKEKILAVKLRQMYSKSATGSYSVLSDKNKSMFGKTSTNATNNKSSVNDSQKDILNITRISDVQLGTPNISKFDLEEDSRSQSKQQRNRYSSLKLSEIAINQWNMDSIETPCFDANQNLKNLNCVLKNKANLKFKR